MRSSATNPAARIFAKNIRPPDGEALRDDENYAAVFRLGISGRWTDAPKLHREPLNFETVHLTQRSYK